MATYIKVGIYQTPNENDQITPEIYVDHGMIQILNEDENLLVQLTYEELRGIMAIMAAEQEKTHLRIIAASRNN